MKRKNPRVRATFKQLCAIAARHHCAVFSIFRPELLRPGSKLVVAGVFYSDTFKHTRPPLRGRADLRLVAHSLTGRRAIALHRWRYSKSTMAHEVAHLLSIVEKCFLDDADKSVTRVFRRCAKRVGIVDDHSLSSREELRAKIFELRAAGAQLPDTLNRLTERIWRSFRESLAAVR